ncbi:HlyD family efflux transporter periplasmic adaptor subunit [Pseudanabaenaceae cyanobacterium LEGE 13415]|nr:HlyD family efflux transporter periplasmic adaptor subunit [Pseudanabaenaceae cyanobacterium LEGE 13415]
MQHFTRPPCSLQHRICSIVMLGSIALCSSCQVQAQNSTPQPSVTPVSDATNVVALGKLEPEGGIIKISVANAQDSRVNQILVKEGDRVQANQVIAVLQGQDRVKQQLNDAQANVAIKQAQLRRVQQGDTKPGELEAQRAAIAELEARLRTETTQKSAVIAETTATLNNAKLQYQRTRSLFQQGAVSRSSIDNAQAEFDKATAAVAQAKADLDNTHSTLQAQLTKARATLDQLQQIRPTDVEVAKAELEQALIQVQQRQAELSDTQVRVPVAGQILRINTQVGEQVNTQEGIVELGQTKQMYVTAEVYETDITRVKKGQTATITSEYGGFKENVKGIVDQVGFQIGKTQLQQDTTKLNTDINSRVVEVKLRLSPEDSAKVASLSGMQVRVRIDSSSR